MNNYFLKDWNQVIFFVENDKKFEKMLNVFNKPESGYI